MVPQTLIFPIFTVRTFGPERELSVTRTSEFELTEELAEELVLVGFGVLVFDAPQRRVKSMSTKMLNRVFMVDSQDPVQQGLRREDRPNHGLGACVRKFPPQNHLRSIRAWDVL